MAQQGVVAAAGIRLLGPLEVVGADIGSAKQRAVLAVLALHLNEVVSRDTLLDRIWGDRPPASAMVTLRSLVSRLRKALDGAAIGCAIVTREPGWVLRGDPGLTDAARFLSMSADARLRLAGNDPAGAAMGLRRALELWRGAALPDVVDAGYLAAEATRLDEARLDAVEDLAGAELAAGWPAEALTRLEPHVAAHPLRERAWGELMTALYHLGRQADALRVYQRVRVLLRDELGVDPTPALRDIEACILRQDPSLAPPPASAVPNGGGIVLSESGPVASVAPLSLAGSNPERTPFVGRAAERAALSALLERVRAGSGGMVFVGGEPGIGKTRLAEEAAAGAIAAGMNVVVGHSYEMAGAAPYVAVVEILEAALAAAPSAEAFLADVLGDAAPEVARLLPQLRRWFPDLPPPLELAPAQERQYLLRCLGESFARLALARPTLVVLDDLQWVDEPTLMFVEHLAPRLAGLPLAVVATYRDTDVGRPLARTFGDLHRRRLATRITLGALTAAETAELVAALAGEDAPAALVDSLYSVTEGNVFFLEELVRDLAESGQAFDGTGRFRTDLDVADLRLPDGVRLVIERRLDRLSDGARSALTAAAVAGRVFSLGLLEAFPDLDAGDVLDIVDEAEQAVLIVPTANDDEFIFAHELIRQTLVAGLSGARRRRFHAGAAEALEQIHAADLGAGAAAIAHHLVEAGSVVDPKRTFRFLALAAKSAMETSAFEEALRHFETALRLDDAGAPRELADLRAGLGRAHRSLGHSDQAVENWRRAIDGYAAIGQAEQEAQVCGELGWHLLWGARWSDAVEWTERGLALLDPEPSPARAGLLVISSIALLVGEQYEEGEVRHRAALLMAEFLGDRHLQGRALFAAATSDWFLSRFVQAVEGGRRAAEMLKECGALWDYVEMLMYVQLALHPIGRWDEAEALDDELAPLAARFGHHFAALLGGRERGARLRNRRPDLGRYETFAHADLVLHRETGLGWSGHSHTFLALADFWQGRWSDALNQTIEATRLETQNGVALWSWSLRLLITAYAGDPDDARCLYRELAPLIPEPGDLAGLGTRQLVFSAVEALATLGDRAEAAALYPLLTEAIDNGMVVDGYVHGRSLQMLAGIAAAAAQRWDTAEQHFEAALTQATEMGLHMERPDILRFYAQMLIDRDGPGDTDRARVLLTEAAEAFTTLSMPRHAKLVGHSLTEL